MSAAMQWKRWPNREARPFSAQQPGEDPREERSNQEKSNRCLALLADIGVLFGCFGRKIVRATPIGLPGGSIDYQGYPSVFPEKRTPMPADSPG